VEPIFRIDSYRLSRTGLKKADWLGVFRDYPPTVFLDVFDSAAIQDERLRSLAARVDALEALMRKISKRVLV